jgi:hypothetical protein
VLILRAVVYIYVFSVSHISFTPLFVRMTCRKPARWFMDAGWIDCAKFADLSESFRNFNELSEVCFPWIWHIIRNGNRNWAEMRHERCWVINSAEYPGNEKTNFLHDGRLVSKYSAGTKRMRQSKRKQGGFFAPIIICFCVYMYKRISLESIYFLLS